MLLVLVLNEVLSFLLHPRVELPKPFVRHRVNLHCNAAYDTQHYNGGYGMSLPTRVTLDVIDAVCTYLITKNPLNKSGGMWHSKDEPAGAG